MGCARSVVKKEWLIRRDGFLFGNVADSLVGDPCGDKNFVIVRDLNLTRVFPKLRMVLIRGRAQEAVEVIETTTGRPPVERSGRRCFVHRCKVPLSDRECVITILTK